jgi:hypothetical protein
VDRTAPAPLMFFERHEDVGVEHHDAARPRRDPDEARIVVPGQLGAPVRARDEAGRPVLRRDVIDRPEAVHHDRPLGAGRALVAMEGLAAVTGEGFQRVHGAQDAIVAEDRADDVEHRRPAHKAAKEGVLPAGTEAQLNSLDGASVPPRRHRSTCRSSACRPSGRSARRVVEQRAGRCKLARAEYVLEDSEAVVRGSSRATARCSGRSSKVGQTAALISAAVDDAASLAGTG